MVTAKNRVAGASRVLACVLVVGALSLGTAGCAANQPAGSGSGSAPVKQEQAKKPQKKTPEQLAAKAYREVLSDPASHFELDSSLSGDATFTYALVNMTTDALPQLLVRATGSSSAWNGTEVVRVFSYDAKGEALVAPATDIAVGVAGAGGFRGGLSCSAYGNGLLYSQMSSGTGQGSITRFTLDGGTLSEAFAAPIDMSTDSSVGTLLNDEGKDIDWVDTSDTAALDTLEAGTWKSTADASSDLKTVAQASGLSTYTGTLRILDAQGVCELTGKANPNPGVVDTKSYVVLDLGSEQQMTLPSGGGDGLRQGSASLLLLDTSESGNSWDALNGKTVTVAVDTDHCHWPSDTSLPLGAPRCANEVAVIE